MFSVKCLKLVVGSGRCRSVCSVSFLTYQGASVIIRSILFCNICILLMFVLDAEPQMEQPYAQICLIIVVYKSFLICSGVCEQSMYDVQLHFFFFI
jgi:hypothetical protein